MRIDKDTLRKWDRQDAKYQELINETIDNMVETVLEVISKSDSVLSIDSISFKKLFDESNYTGKYSNLIN
jgi:hypothetical protein